MKTPDTALVIREPMAIKGIKYVDKAICDSVNPHCYQVLQNATQKMARLDDTFGNLCED